MISILLCYLIEIIGNPPFFGKDGSIDSLAEPWNPMNRLHAEIPNLDFLFEQARLS